MISIACDHPDLEDFIEIKSDLDKVTKANISVRVTSKFMDAIIEDKDFVLSFTRDETNETIAKTIKARELFDKLCYMNWDYAEPAILYWDRIKDWNLLSNNNEFEYAGVNPCAEEPLPSGGSCLLGSINLAEFVWTDEHSGAHFDWSEFAKTVKLAVSYLNEILDEGLSLHPLDIQQQTVRDWRQIGLGIMGLADMLIKMKMPYGSEEAINLCEQIGFELANTAIEQSAQLADIYGTYPMYDSNVMATKFFETNTSWDTDKNVDRCGLRNSQLLTIAPTGTLSTMLQISGGIEPIFANSYTRKTESLHGEDKYYKIYTPIVKKYMDTHGITEEEDLPSWFVTAHTINPIDRIKMQGIWQKHIDASISSTINLPQEATVEDVKEIYIEAYRHGLKGVTVFRDGCKRLGILTTDDTNDECDNNTTQEIPRGYIIDVSDDLTSEKRTLRTGCGKLYVHLDSDEATCQPLETWVECGSGGGCERNLTFISRLMSLALRSGVPIESIIDQCRSIRPCNAYRDRKKDYGDTSKGTSCPSAIGYALEELNQKIKDRCGDGDIEIEEYPYETTWAGDRLCIIAEEDEEEMISSPEAHNDGNVAKCPECGRPLMNTGGCVQCECGYSPCG